MLKRLQLMFAPDSPAGITQPATPPVFNPPPKPAAAPPPAATPPPPPAATPPADQPPGVKEALERMQRADAAKWEAEKRAKDLEDKLKGLTASQQALEAAFKADPIKFAEDRGMSWEALVDRASTGRAGADEKATAVQKVLEEVVKRLDGFEQNLAKDAEAKSKAEEDRLLVVFADGTRGVMDGMVAQDPDLGKALAWLDVMSGGKASFAGEELKQKLTAHFQATQRHLTKEEAAGILVKELKDHQAKLRANLAFRKAAADYLNLVLPDAPPAGSPPASPQPGAPTLTQRDQQSAPGGLPDLSGKSRAEIANLVKASFGVKD